MQSQRAEIAAEFYPALSFDVLVLASLDHAAAAQAPNFITIPISSGVP